MHTAESTVRPSEERKLPGPDGAAGQRARPMAMPDAENTSDAASTGVRTAGDAELEELRALGARLALAVLGPESLVSEPAALAAVSRESAQHAGALPLALRGGVLRVAVSDPLTPALDALAHEAQAALEPVLAPAAAIRAALARCYAPVDAPKEERANAVSSSEPGAADDAPMARLVQHLVEEAIRRRASDIHIEPLAKRLRVRLRIDGVLQEIDSPPPQVQAALISRLKVAARMELDEKRVPQDGRIQLSVEGRSVDLRASCLPTVHGESIVLRLLEAERLALDWTTLGLWPDDERLLARAVAAPDGLVLVTGPTGSGKTTTLYSCLHRLNRADRKIVTVEDPVEYQLAGINQVPVRPETGMTFAAALRALLRQAPNVIMIGEIRDRETAEIALDAAQTGHLVFSTLHTNDASGAVARLIDLGAKPYLLAATLRAVVAQRLVRRVCPAGCSGWRC